MVRLSSWKVNPPTLRTMLAIRWLAASDSGWPSDQAGLPSAVLFSTPRNPLASRRSAAGAEVGQGMQRVADHHPHAGERRVQPVDRRLALLEVVQVHPAPFDTVGADDRAGHAPVRLLDALGVEDHPLQASDDVTGLVQPFLGGHVDVDRVRTRRGRRAARPSLAGRSRPCGRCRGSPRISSPRAGSRRPCRCDRARCRR